MADWARSILFNGMIVMMLAIIWAIGWCSEIQWQAARETRIVGTPANLADYAHSSTPTDSVATADNQP